MFVTLFKEDFEKYDEGRFPKNSGWISKKLRSQAKDQTTFSESIFISRDSISGLKTLKLNPIEDNQVIVVKRFNIPGNFPFDTSDRLFEIKYNEEMEELRSQESVVSDQEKLSGQLSVFSGQPLYNEDYFKTFSTFDDENSHGPNTGNNFGGISTASGAGRSQSTSMINTYYIYSFDGKLMAEYDHDGNCVKDYIYAGNKLIAEYQPQENKYYYYMSDQITSTRIITDDSGNVVYSVAHRPFGKFKDVWTKTYDPKLKFSGKEREDYSDLDYFGARYYDSNSYRFISVDPIINKREALINPQLWNLYSYCANNPVTFMDPDGRAVAVLGGYLAVEGLQWLGVAIAAIVGAKAIYDTWPNSYEFPDKIVPIEEVIGPWDPTKDPISINPVLEIMDQIIQTSKAKDESERKKRSEEPIGKRKTYDTRKGAKEAATKAGKGNKPVNHPKGKYGPHFHPGDERGRPLNHDHYGYPKNKK